MCSDKTSGSIDYLIFNWKKKKSSLCTSQVNGNRYALLKSVTAGVHLQAKGKVDAACPVHRARQKASSSAVTPSSSSGLCRSELLACTCVLSAAPSLAVLTYWQEKVLHSCQFSASGTAPAFAIRSLWVSAVQRWKNWRS